MPKYVPTTDEELRQDSKMYVIISAIALCLCVFAAMAYVLKSPTASALPMVKHELKVGDKYRIPLNIFGIQVDLEGTVEKIESVGPTLDERWPAPEVPSFVRPVKLIPHKRPPPPPQIDNPWNQW